MTKAERSRPLRYKRGALASMGYQAMDDELEAIVEQCDFCTGIATFALKPAYMSWTGSAQKEKEHNE